MKTDDDPLNCGSCAPCPAAPPGAVAVCQAGVCGTRCAQGWVDCGGTCVSLKGDTANCGACNKACAAGETCAGGECIVPSAAVIATGFTSGAGVIGEIALDANAVYVLDTKLGSITRIDKATLAQTVLVPNAYVSTTVVPRMVAAGGFVYWNASLAGAIVRVPATGGSIVSMVANPSNRSFAVDPSTIYIAGLSVAPNAPGAVATPLAMTFFADEVVNAGPSLFSFWRDRDHAAVVRFEKASGKLVDTPGQIVSGAPWGLVVGEGFVSGGGPRFGGREVLVSARRPETAPYGYIPRMWQEYVPAASAGAADACSTFNGVGSDITQRDGADGPRRLVGAGVATSVARMAADATHVYWLDRAGFVGRIKH